MKRVLVSETIAETGLDLLRSAGHNVDVQLGLSPDGLCEAVAGASALIVRSATQVDAAVLEAGADLVVVGRAGVGVDNVDVVEAAKHGVIVVNAPLSNVTSAAEHSMALLLAQARNVPQAHAAMLQGRWERSQWQGVELAGKTLGVIGLGRIGSLVAERALAFGMKIVAHDPYITQEAADRVNAELIELDELIERSDFVTLHLLKTPETVGLIGAELLAKAKPSLRIVNVSRGGVIDEEALADAVRSKKIAGAAIDVFDVEPALDSPLVGVDGIVVTPHLGASTAEAQLAAGITIAEQVQLALAGEAVPFAVNQPSAVNQTPA